MTLTVIANDEPERDDAMSESRLLARACRACRHYGLLVHHINHGEVVMTGAPDMVVAGPRGQAWFELKSAVGDLSPAQQDWAEMLKAGGANYSVITPFDWYSGVFEERLRALAEEEWEEAA